MFKLASFRIDFQTNSQTKLENEGLGTILGSSKMKVDSFWMRILYLFFWGWETPPRSQEFQVSALNSFGGALVETRWIHEISIFIGEANFKLRVGNGRLLLLEAEPIIYEMGR